jgi:hypothetical protein
LSRLWKTKLFLHVIMAEAMGPKTSQRVSAQHGRVESQLVKQHS